ncbi:UbiA family prenyltransferase [[Limnothrix rosea] IAM M-220]|uniref:UbiA family prenyltransferase n=1 Tax=[Limnothrix rosea] IAM M-220 TaxID=454133 RepID=UPI000967C61B|nr:UbiA family prenyltransferase [[Limnothrix rosea] IAM M-220]OKH11061.1 hypothetical protein NIES208_17795 [[Limnothrix rosea] IAM M-220]
MRPLVVDLDGTLIRTDLLYESANHHIAKSPFQIFNLIAWASKSKAYLKSALAAKYNIHVESLPYNEDLLRWLRSEKAESGRTIVLATASHHKLVEAIAEHLQIFDAVFATNDNLNLKGTKKRNLLVEKFGEKGFDYIGDCEADLPVWQSAEEAYIVSSSESFIKKVQQQCNVIDVFQSRQKSYLASLAKALRPYQWVKNVLLFLPLLGSHLYGDLSLVIAVAMAFAMFSLTASSVYLLNDLIDVNDDRHHHRKRKRPFASGAISLLDGWLIWPCLLGIAFLLAFLLLPPAFMLALGAYYSLTLTYSLFLKRRPLVDVISLAALYTLRIIAGAAATGIVPSFWLLAFSMFVFLSLAFVKRFSELYAAKKKNKGKKLRGRGYSQDDLELVSTMGITSAYMSILVLALYIQDPNTINTYASPKLIWFACPLMLYWVSRIWLITHRGHMHDDPIVFALKDKASWVTLFSFLAVFGVARFGGNQLILGLSMVGVLVAIATVVYLSGHLLRKANRNSAGFQIAALYGLFAIIATTANIGTQALVITIYTGSYAVTLSILAGTAVGLPIKYILDKLYIFKFKAKNLAHDSNLFFLYAFMSLFTTALFWGTEYLFHWLFHTDAMRYLGGVIGLMAGYTLKYSLDKRFVFVDKSPASQEK